MMANPDEKFLRIVAKEDAENSSKSTRGGQNASPPPKPDELEQLRSALFGHERNRLGNIENSIHNGEEHSKLVSRDLPRAVSSRLARDRALHAALEPAVEDILQHSVRRNPHVLVNALSPVIGPSIRRAVTDALRSMMQSLNEALEHSLSWKGLKWRVEALRTGKPYAEIVLMHSLVYRVEQVFLIHKETGLVLQHVAAEAIIHQDADLVSSMLTAIQDFVKDSFSSQDALDELRLGELQVVIQQDEDAVLAGVVRGRPPVELQSVFLQTLQDIQGLKAPELKTFNGDAAPFEEVRPQLEDCLQARYQKEGKKGFPLYTLLIGLLIAGLLGYWLFTRYAAQERWDAYIQRLDQEPGIVVVKNGRQDGKRFIQGLRDPLAASPESLLAETGLPQKDVELIFEPYQALTPEFVLNRARQALAPPDSVSLELDNGILRATGEAPFEWLETARKTAQALPGVTAFDTAALRVDYADTLRQAHEWLQPPPSVTLDVADGVLRAQGLADPGWIARAKSAAPALRGVTAYDDTQLDIDTSRELQHIINALRPPKSVTLQLPEDTIKARGEAPYPWMLKAREQAPLLSHRRYDDSELRPDYQDTLRRLQEALPDSGSPRLRLEDGLLTATGSVPHDYLGAFKQAVKKFPEITQVQDQDLKDADLQEFHRLRDKIQTTTIEFEPGQSDPRELNTEKLESLATHMLALLARAKSLHTNAGFTIAGFADPVGGARYNQELSEKRAEQTKLALNELGVPLQALATIGKGAPCLASDAISAEKCNDRRAEVMVTRGQTGDL